MSRLTTTIALLCLVQMSSAFPNDVEVKLVRDDVWVVGDSDANDIEIRKIYGAVHQFRGLRGTTINGSSDPVVLPIQDDLKIWMLGGDDYVDIRYAYLRGTSHADLMIELGRDNDELYLYSGSIRRNLILSDAGVYRGDDTITVRSLSAHAIDIETQGSADIDVRSNRVSWMAIESGRRGADDISVVNNDANLIDIFTSDTVDVLDFMANDVAGGLLAVDLRDGNDLLYLDDNTLNLTNALFDGGSGTFDFVSGAEVYDWPWWGHIKVVNFEN